MSIENAFFLKNSSNSFPIVIITGTCRSGKTLLGNLLATCKQIEYADEPYFPMMLSITAKSGKIDSEFAMGLLNASLSELFNNLLLLRAANFRPGDLSTIWDKKSPEEILNRLINLKTREEAMNYAKQNKAQLIVTLAEATPFLDFIIKALPKATVIHVIRNPFQVAAEIALKKWFSNAQLLNPLNAQPYLIFQDSSNTWYMPWWVYDHEYEYFLNLSDYDRGLYYWWVLMDTGMKAFNLLNCQKLIVYYQDLVANSLQTFKKISNLLGLDPGKLTDIKLKTIENRPFPMLEKKSDPIILERVTLIQEMI